MASDTLLNLVNRVLVTTGDYSKVTTVASSPANIAERIMHFLNMTAEDLARRIDFPELYTSFTGTGDGINSTFQSSLVTPSFGSMVSCIVGTIPLEEVSRKALEEERAMQTRAGLPAIFSRYIGAGQELGVDIYPTPASGSTINVLASIKPAQFSLIDSATIEINSSDLLVLGAIAHSDAFAGMERGYMQLYEVACNKEWRSLYDSQQLRVTPEDYR